MMRASLQVIDVVMQCGLCSPSTVSRYGSVVNFEASSRNGSTTAVPGTA